MERSFCAAGIGSYGILLGVEPTDLYSITKHISPCLLVAHISSYRGTDDGVVKKGKKIQLNIDGPHSLSQLPFDHL